MDFSKEIISWYEVNKRDLPWRKTKNPYHIWLSEIILQQTRVEQGLPYYNKFIDKFPTITDLHKADESEVLKLWQGLGYYSRARNLHKAAHQIVETFDRQFPDNKKELLKLTGVGDYTASAIASFCYKEPTAVIDGNVYRVLSRYFGIKTPIDSSEGKKLFEQVANDMLNKNCPDTYNQAIMEFGALQCTPKSPNCSNCPLQIDCIAKREGIIDQLPVKSKKTKQRDRYFYYLDIESNDRTYLNKRTKKDIWQNLYEYPLIEKDNPIDINHIFDEPEFKVLNLKSPVIERTSSEVKHVLSHQIIHAVFIKIKSKQPLTSNQLVEIEVKDIHQFPTHRLMENYLNTK